MISVKTIKRAILFAIGIVAGVLAFMFAMLNHNSVQLNLYFFDPFLIPVWLLVLFSMILGWLVPRLVGIRIWLRTHRERAGLIRTIEDLEEEVRRLRNIPIDFDQPLSPKLAQLDESSLEQVKGSLATNLMEENVSLAEQNGEACMNENGTTPKLDDSQEPKAVAADNLSES